jgi:hypothetical protein
MKTLFAAVHAVMERRILVNFRARPEVIAPLLPEPFRPKLINGCAMAGICLIRLQDMRPKWVPRPFGMSSENAAHRIAVEWTANGQTHEGVFIPRRDTDSLLNRIAGGRLFPGVHHPARFRCMQSESRFEVQLHSEDGEANVHVAAHLADVLAEGSVFGSLDKAVAFFRSGSCGWSPGNGDHRVEGVELWADDWTMHPLKIEHVESSFFDNQLRFPRGSVEFDCALLMRGVSHEWRALSTFPSECTARQHQHHRLAALFEMP